MSIYAAAALLSTLAGEFASATLQKSLRLGDHIPRLSGWQWAVIGLGLLLVLGIHGAAREFRSGETKHKAELEAEQDAHSRTKALQSQLASEVADNARVAAQAAAEQAAVARENMRRKREKDARKMREKMRPVLKGDITPWPGRNDGRDHRLEVRLIKGRPLMCLTLVVPANAGFSRNGCDVMSSWIQFPEPGRPSQHVRPGHPASWPVCLSGSAHGTVMVIARCRQDDGYLWDEDDGIVVPIFID